MNISDEALREFIKISKEDYGIELTEGEARVRATRLLLLFELIHRPLPAERETTRNDLDAGSL